MVNSGMSESLEPIKPLLYTIGVGGMGGFFLGYILKRIFNRMIIIILGVFTFGLLYLAQVRAIDLKFENMFGLISAVGNFFNQTIAPLMANVPFVGSFLVGLWGGFRQG